MAPSSKDLNAITIGDLHRWSEFVQAVRSMPKLGGSITFGDHARATQVSTSTITRTFDRLEEVFERDLTLKSIKRGIDGQPVQDGDRSTEVTRWGEYLAAVTELFLLQLGQVLDDTGPSIGVAPAASISADVLDYARKLYRDEELAEFASPPRAKGLAGIAANQVKARDGGSDT